MNGDRSANSSASTGGTKPKGLLASKLRGVLSGAHSVSNISRVTPVNPRSKDRQAKTLRWRNLPEGAFFSSLDVLKCLGVVSRLSAKLLPKAPEADL